MTQTEGTDSPDQSLLARAIQGDAQAFGDLYERHLDEIQRFIFYHVANRLEAEDLTEIVFLKAWQALPRFKTSNVNLRAWLFRIAHNSIVDYYRMCKPMTNLLDGQLQEDHPSPEHQAQTRDDHQKLLAAIHSLGVKLKQVIICRFVSNLSHAETAQVMGIKEQHVRVLQHRALKKLRQILEEEQ